MKANGALYVLILPAVLMFFIFRYIPLYGVTMAFKDFKISSGYFSNNDWVGLKHFARILNDAFMWRAIKNTIILNVYNLAFSFPAPILFALMLNEVYSDRYKRIIQTVSYLPHFVSTVVVIGLLKAFLASDGEINNLIVAMGGEVKIFWSDANWFRSLYITSGIWQNLGWSSIIYLASLAGIDPQLYEAAHIDGAGRFQKIIHVTIPGIMPTIIILFILAVGNMMKVGFTKVFLMYNETIFSKADVISTYVYRKGLEGKQYSYASAVGLVENVVNFMLLYIANTLSKKYTESSLW